MLELLDKFYPELETTVTSSDPPTVKALLRRKNRLMRAGRTDETGAIAARIRTIITRRSTSWLRTADTRKSAKDTWAKVREVIKRSAIRDGDQIDGLTAQSLNDHCEHLSRQWLPRVEAETDGIRRFDPHHGDDRFLLDTLHPTSTGLDRIPRRGFSDSVRLPSLHRSLVCSTSRWQQASCRTSGRLPLYRRSPRLPRRRRRATSGQFQSHQFCRARSSASSSVPTSTRHYCSRVRHLTSVTSSRSDRRDRRRCCTPSAQCWPRTISYTSSTWTFRRRLTQSGMHH